MTIVYAVEYIEVEFGQRPWGYKLYMELDECIKTSKEDSGTEYDGEDSGTEYDGELYIGPVRPLKYVEVPWDSVDERSKESLATTGRAFTVDNWTPKFSSKSIR